MPDTHPAMLVTFSDLRELDVSDTTPTQYVQTTYPGLGANTTTRLVQNIANRPRSPPAPAIPKVSSTASHDAVFRDVAGTVTRFAKQAVESSNGSGDAFVESLRCSYEDNATAVDSVIEISDSPPCSTKNIEMLDSDLTNIVKGSHLEFYSIHVGQEQVPETTHDLLSVRTQFPAPLPQRVPDVTPKHLLSLNVIDSSNQPIIPPVRSGDDVAKQQNLPLPPSHITMFSVPKPDLGFHTLGESSAAPTSSKSISIAGSETSNLSFPESHLAAFNIPKSDIRFHASSQSTLHPSSSESNNVPNIQAESVLLSPSSVPSASSVASTSATPNTPVNDTDLLSYNAETGQFEEAEAVKNVPAGADRIFFKCPECARRFYHKRSLTRHLSVNHTAKRSHVCTECNRSFLTAQTLKEHTNIHYGLRPFTCSVCGIGFANRGSLYTHSKRYHKTDEQQ